MNEENYLWQMRYVVTGINIVFLSCFFHNTILGAGIAIAVHLIASSAIASEKVISSDKNEDIHRQLDQKGKALEFDEEYWRILLKLNLD